MRASKKKNMMIIGVIVIIVVIGAYMVREELFDVQQYPYELCLMRCNSNGATAWMDIALVNTPCDEQCVERNDLGACIKFEFQGNWENTDDCKCCPGVGQTCTYDMAPCQTTTTTTIQTTTTLHSTTTSTIPGQQPEEDYTLLIIGCAVIFGGIGLVIWRRK